MDGTPTATEQTVGNKSTESAKKRNKTPTVTYGGLELPVLNQKDALVPKTAISIHLPDEDERALALAVKHDLPTLLIGETGTGKTSAVRQLAYLRKQGYVRINMHGYNTPDELIGSKSAKNGSTYYENGILTNAMINGHMVVLDEINATPPDCTFIIHGLLDEDKRVSLPNGDVITPHKDFRFFATMNPDYEGTKSLNRALLDRFNIILNIKTLEPKREEALLVERNDISEEVAQNMVIVAWSTRKAYAEGKTMNFISTRSLLQWSRLVAEGMDIYLAYQTSIINKVRSEEYDAMRDFYCAVFKINPTDDDRLDMPTITTLRTLNGYNAQIEALKKDNLKMSELVDKANSIVKENDALYKRLQAADKTIAKQTKDLEKIKELEVTINQFKQVLDSASVSKPSTDDGQSTPGTTTETVKTEMPF